MFQAFLRYVKVLEGVPGFLEGVPGYCSGFSRRCSGAFRVFHTVPGVPGCSGVPCSGVPVFRCSGVPVFLELLHAHFMALMPVATRQICQCKNEFLTNSHASCWLLSSVNDQATLFC